MPLVALIAGFGSSANYIINSSVELANRIRNTEINSLHVMSVLLDNEFFDDRFSDLADYSASDFKMAMLETLESESIDEDEYIEVSLDNASKELCRVLITAKNKCGDNGNIPVAPIDIFKAIFINDQNRVVDLMKEMGIGEVMIPSESIMSDMPITSTFATDLNELYESGKIDPVISRDKIIDRMIEVLGRRTQSNPCLIGESGVGKTSIVEGLAARIESGDVPDHLRGYHILSVDISGILSGSKYRGEFEEKFNNMLYEAQNKENVILFFDEMHTLMEAGANSSESSMTASNILKPAMTKGGVKIIGATTTNEYRKFIEKDNAFLRRIMPIMVDEPTEDEAVKMILGIANIYEEYHNARISSDVIKASVSLSRRYIADRRLPDKAISIIDETASRLKSNHSGVSYISVDDIRETISNVSGVDIRCLDGDDRRKLMNLERTLAESVIGQREAIESVSKAIRRNKAGINEPNRPVGSFLFVGPTGVGKTELAKNISREFGSGELIRFDMSEYMEKYSISKLIGSAPGYIGYNDGGKLTEVVKRKPYSVILFDEIEKAHPDVFNLLLQILDEGCLTDSHGSKVDFKNTVIILTSNAGYGLEGSGVTNSIGFGASRSSGDETSNDQRKTIKALESTFRPEFLNRLDKVVVFNHLSRDESKQIINLLLSNLATRVLDKNISLTWRESLVNELLESGFSDKYGARNLKRRIQTLVEDEIADKLIKGGISSGDSIALGFKEGKVTVYVRHPKNVRKLGDKILEEQHA